MKRISLIFAQAVMVLTGMVVLVFLIRFPLTEGRATNLDLFSIYADPFILYGYAASTAFFIGLYQAFKFLGYVKQNKVSSPNSLRSLKRIKYCATALSILIVAAGLYIKLSHHEDDDPAGFLAVCILTTLISIGVAAAAAKFEKSLQNGVAMKSDNGLIS